MDPSTRRLGQPDTFTYIIVRLDERQSCTALLIKQHDTPIITSRGHEAAGPVHVVDLFGVCTFKRRRRVLAREGLGLDMITYRSNDELVVPIMIRRRETARC